ncbi:MAG: class I SAM-dependent methyltransferase [Actinomycetota bacterium]
MIAAVDPKPGSRILDFACGAGVTSAWLARTGAHVTGVDLSHVSIARAEELRDAVGLQYELKVVGSQAGDIETGEQFDGLIGRFALHHVDLATYGPALASLLKPGGTAAFFETMATNPFLNVIRKNVAGRFGIHRFGSEDEHPLDRKDLTRLRADFGALDVRTPLVVFFSLIDRHVLRGRSPKMTRFLFRVDGSITRRPRLRFLSYNQVLVLQRSGSSVS